MATEFMPVFHAGAGCSGPGHIEFLFPNAAVIGLTGEAPDGFEGAYCFNEPPIYPCMIITGGSPLRRVPNRVLRNAADLKAFRVEFEARDLWKYHPGAEHYNQTRRAENKARGDAAVMRLSAAPMRIDSN